MLRNGAQWCGLASGRACPGCAGWRSAGSFLKQIAELVKIGAIQGALWKWNFAYPLPMEALCLLGQREARAFSRLAFIAASLALLLLLPPFLP